MEPQAEADLDPPPPAPEVVCLRITGSQDKCWDISTAVLSSNNTHAFEGPCYFATLSVTRELTNNNPNLYKGRIVLLHVDTAPVSFIREIVERLTAKGAITVVVFAFRIEPDIPPLFELSVMMLQAFPQWAQTYTELHEEQKIGIPMRIVLRKEHTRLEQRASEETKSPDSGLWRRVKGVWAFFRGKDSYNLRDDIEKLLTLLLNNQWNTLKVANEIEQVLQAIRDHASELKERDSELNHSIPRVLQQVEMSIRSTSIEQSNIGLIPYAICITHKIHQLLEEIAGGCKPRYIYAFTNVAKALVQRGQHLVAAQRTSHDVLNHVTDGKVFDVKADVPAGIYVLLEAALKIAGVKPDEFSDLVLALLGLALNPVFEEERESQHLKIWNLFTPYVERGIESGKMLRMPAERLEHLLFLSAGVLSSEDFLIITCRTLDQVVKINDLALLDTFRLLRTFVRFACNSGIQNETARSVIGFCFQKAKEIPLVHWTQGLSFMDVFLVFADIYSLMLKDEAVWSETKKLLRMMTRSLDFEQEDFSAIVLSIPWNDLAHLRPQEVIAKEVMDIFGNGKWVHTLIGIIEAVVRTACGDGMHIPRFKEAWIFVYNTTGELSRLCQWKSNQICSIIRCLGRLPQSELCDGLSSNNVVDKYLSSLTDYWSGKRKEENCLSVLIELAGSIHHVEAHLENNQKQVWFDLLKDTIPSSTGSCALKRQNLTLLMRCFEDMSCEGNAVSVCQRFALRLLSAAINSAYESCTVDHQARACNSLIENLSENATGNGKKETILQLFISFSLDEYWSTINKNELSPSASDAYNDPYIQFVTFVRSDPLCLKVFVLCSKMFSQCTDPEIVTSRDLLFWRQSQIRCHDALVDKIKRGEISYFACEELRFLSPEIRSVFLVASETTLMLALDEISCQFPDLFEQAWEASTVIFSRDGNRCSWLAALSEYGLTVIDDFIQPYMFENKKEFLINAIQMIEYATLKKQIEHLRRFLNFLQQAQVSERFHGKALVPAPISSNVDMISFFIHFYHRKSGLFKALLGNHMPRRIPCRLEEVRITLANVYRQFEGINTASFSDFKRLNDTVDIEAELLTISDFQPYGERFRQDYIRRLRSLLEIGNFSTSLRYFVQFQDKTSLFEGLRCDESYKRLRTLRDLEPEVLERTDLERAQAVYEEALECMGFRYVDGAAASASRENLFKTLQVFHVLNDCDELIRFVIDRGFHGEGSSTFQRQYNHMSDYYMTSAEEFDNDLMANLRNAVDLVAPYVELRTCSLVDLISQLIIRISTPRYVNVDADGVRLVANNMNRVSLLWQRALNEEQDFLYELNELSRGRVAFLLDDDNYSMHFLSPDSKVLRTVEKLDDLTLQLRFIEQDKPEIRHQIRRFLFATRSAQRLYTLFERLRLLGTKIHLRDGTRQYEISISDLRLNGDHLFEELSKLVDQVGQRIRDSCQMHRFLACFTPAEILCFSRFVREGMLDAIAHSLSVTVSTSIPLSLLEALCKEHFEQDMNHAVDFLNENRDLSFIHGFSLPARVVAVFLESVYKQLGVSWIEALPLRSDSGMFDVAPRVCLYHTDSWQPDRYKIFGCIMRAFQYRRLPEAFEVLQCSENTTLAELDTFFSRVEACAGRTFVIVAFNALTSRAQEKLIRFLLSVRHCGDVHCIETAPSALRALQWCEHIKAPDKESVVLPQRLVRLMSHRSTNTLEVVTGAAGSGKTHFINKRARGTSNFVTVTLSEQFTAEDVFARLIEVSSIRGHTVAVHLNICLGVLTLSELALFTEKLDLLFFNLFVLQQGHLVDGRIFTFGGSRKSWRIFVEVPDRVGHVLDGPVGCEPSMLEDLLCLKCSISRENLFRVDEEANPLEIDNNVQLVCKYLKTLKKRNQLICYGDNRIQISNDPELSSEECNALIVEYFPAHVERSRMTMFFFIKTLAWRFKAMDESVFIQYYNGQIPDPEVRGRKLENPSMVRNLIAKIVSDCGRSMNENIRSNWTKSLHVQLIPVKEGTFPVLCANVEHLTVAQREEYTQLGCAFPTLSQQHDREYLDQQLITALNMTPRSRLEEIDMQSFVLTMDYTIKIINLYERIQNGVPVLIEGETGVGKTALVHILSILQNVARRAHFALSRIHCLQSCLSSVLHVPELLTIDMGLLRTTLAFVYRSALCGQHEDADKISQRVMRLLSTNDPRGTYYSLNEMRELAEWCLAVENEDVGDFDEAIDRHVDRFIQVVCARLYQNRLNVTTRLSERLGESLAKSIVALLSSSRSCTQTDAEELRKLLRPSAIVTRTTCSHNATYVEGEEVEYVRAADLFERATILRVTSDDFTNVYYTVRSHTTGRESQTDSSHLRPVPRPEVDESTMRQSRLYQYAEALARDIVQISTTDAELADKLLLLMRNTLIERFFPSIADIRTIACLGRCDAEGAFNEEAIRNAFITLLITPELVTFRKLQVHCSLTEADVSAFMHEVINDANQLLDLFKKTRLQHPPTITVFLDEINTSSCMGIMKEIILDRTICGTRIPRNVSVVCASNPYRCPLPRGKFASAAGPNSAVGDENELLFGHYQVKPLPQTLRQIRWDFGALSSEEENHYVQQKLQLMRERSWVLTAPETLCLKLSRIINGINRVEYRSNFPGLLPQSESFTLSETVDVERKLSSLYAVSSIVPKSHELLRNYKYESLMLTHYADRVEVTTAVHDDALARSRSIVSQRDIQRVFNLAEFFVEVSRSRGVNTDFEGCYLRSFILAVACVYFLRLSTEERDQYLRDIASSMPPQFDMEQLLEEEIGVFLQEAQIPKGIVTNQAFKENVYMSILACVTCIPLIIIGPPGSSKTQSFHVAVSTLRGQESRSVFYRSKLYPEVEAHHYQCSRRSTDLEIKKIFERAIRKQLLTNRQGMNRQTVVFLDEAGLPETKSQALKVLHYYMESEFRDRTNESRPRVACVAISNHMLDAAITNRAIVLTRSPPTERDMLQIAGAAMQTTIQADDEFHICTEVLRVISRFFYQLLSASVPEFDQHELDQLKRFHGCRDFMAMMRYISRHSLGSGRIQPETLVKAVQRNFGGSPHADKVMKILLNNLRPLLPCVVREHSHGIDLITHRQLEQIQAMQNLKKDEDFNEAVIRYALVIDETGDDSAVRLLALFGALDMKQNMLICSGGFPADGEAHFVRIISRVKYAATNGQTIFFAGVDAINESFYDLFNQRFRSVPNARDGSVKLYTNIAVGTLAAPCPVSPDFSCIVLLRAKDVALTPRPFLDRFEKQRVSLKEYLYTQLQKLPSQIRRVIEIARRNAETLINILGESGLSGGTDHESLLDSVIISAIGLSVEAIDSSVDDSCSILADLRASLGSLGFMGYMSQAEQVFFENCVLGLYLSKESQRSLAAPYRRKVFTAFLKGLAEDDESLVGLEDVGDSFRAARHCFLLHFESLLALRLLRLARPLVILMVSARLPMCIVEHVLQDESCYSLKELVSQVLLSPPSFPPFLMVFCPDMQGIHELSSSHRLVEDSLTRDAEMNESVRKLVSADPSQVVVMKLEHIETQDDYDQLIKAMFSSHVDEHLLLILCDSRLTSTAQVNYIRTTAEHLYAQAKTDSDGKKVIFLLHGNGLQYPALFLWPWHHVYLDTYSKGILDIGSLFAALLRRRRNENFDDELNRFQDSLRVHCSQQLSDVVTVLVSRRRFPVSKLCMVNSETSWLNRRALLLEILLTRPEDGVDLGTALVQMFCELLTLSILEELLLVDIGSINKSKGLSYTFKTFIDSIFRDFIMSAVLEINENMNLDLLLEALRHKQADVLRNFHDFLPLIKPQSLQNLGRYGSGSASSAIANLPTQTLWKKPHFPFFAKHASALRNACGVAISRALQRDNLCIRSRSAMISETCEAVCDIERKRRSDCGPQLLDLRARLKDPSQVDLLKRFVQDIVTWELQVDCPSEYNTSSLHGVITNFLLHRVLRDGSSDLIWLFTYVSLNRLQLAKIIHNARSMYMLGNDPEENTACFVTEDSEQLQVFVIDSLRSGLHVLNEERGNVRAESPTWTVCCEAFLAQGMFDGFMIPDERQKDFAVIVAVYAFTRHGGSFSAAARHLGPLILELNPLEWFQSLTTKLIDVLQSLPCVAARTRVMEDVIETCLERCQPMSDSILSAVPVLLNSRDAYSEEFWLTQGMRERLLKLYIERCPSGATAKLTSKNTLKRIAECLLKNENAGEATFFVPKHVKVLDAFAFFDSVGLQSPGAVSGPLAEAYYSLQLSICQLSYSTDNFESLLVAIINYRQKDYPAPLGLIHLAVLEEVCAKRLGQIIASQATSSIGFAAKAGARQSLEELNTLLTEKPILQAYVLHSIRAHLSNSTIIFSRFLIQNEPRLRTFPWLAPHLQELRCYLEMGEDSPQPQSLPCFYDRHSDSTQQYVRFMEISKLENSQQLQQALLKFVTSVCSQSEQSMRDLRMVLLVFLHQNKSRPFFQRVAVQIFERELRDDGPVSRTLQLNDQHRTLFLVVLKPAEYAHRRMERPVINGENWMTHDDHAAEQDSLHDLFLTPSDEEKPLLDSFINLAAVIISLPEKSSHLCACLFNPSHIHNTIACGSGYDIPVTNVVHYDCGTDFQFDGTLSRAYARQELCLPARWFMSWANYAAIAMSLLMGFTSSEQILGAVFSPRLSIRHYLLAVVRSTWLFLHSNLDLTCDRRDILVSNLLYTWRAKCLSEESVRGYLFHTPEKVRAYETAFNAEIFVPVHRNMHQLEATFCSSLQISDTLAAAEAPLPREPENLEGMLAAAADSVLRLDEQDFESKIDWHTARLFAEFIMSRNQEAMRFTVMLPLCVQLYHWLHYTLNGILTDSDSQEKSIPQLTDELTIRNPMMRTELQCIKRVYFVFCDLFNAWGTVEKLVGADGACGDAAELQARQEAAEVHRPRLVEVPKIDERSSLLLFLDVEDGENWVWRLIKRLVKIHNRLVDVQNPQATVSNIFEVTGASVITDLSLNEAANVLQGVPSIGQLQLPKRLGEIARSRHIRDQGTFDINGLASDVCRTYLIGKSKISDRSVEDFKRSYRFRKSTEAKQAAVGRSSVGATVADLANALDPSLKMPLDDGTLMEFRALTASLSSEAVKRLFTGLTNVLSYFWTNTDRGKFHPSLCLGDMLDAMGSTRELADVRVHADDLATLGFGFMDPTLKLFLRSRLTFDRLLAVLTALQPFVDVQDDYTELQKPLPRDIIGSLVELFEGADSTMMRKYITEVDQLLTEYNQQLQIYLTRPLRSFLEELHALAENNVLINLIPDAVEVAHWASFKAEVQALLEHQQTGLIEWNFDSDAFGLEGTDPQSQDDVEPSPLPVPLSRELSTDSMDAGVEEAKGADMSQLQYPTMAEYSARTYEHPGLFSRTVSKIITDNIDEAEVEELMKEEAQGALSASTFLDVGAALLQKNEDSRISAQPLLTTPPKVNSWLEYDRNEAALDHSVACTMPSLPPRPAQSQTQLFTNDLPAVSVAEGTEDTARESPHVTLLREHLCHVEGLDVSSVTQALISNGFGWKDVMGLSLEDDGWSELCEDALSDLSEEGRGALRMAARVADCLWKFVSAIGIEEFTQDPRLLIYRAMLATGSKWEDFHECITSDNPSVWRGMKERLSKSGVAAGHLIKLKRHASLCPGTFHSLG